MGTANGPNDQGHEKEHKRTDAANAKFIAYL